MVHKLDRREFLKAAAASAAVAALAGCKPEVVEKEVTRVVEATAVPTAVPTPAPIVANINMALNRGDIGDAGEPGCSGAVNSYFMNYMMFAALVRLNDKLEIEPDLAESWTVSDDGMTYTFKIKADAKWSDGSPLTANDFEWSIKRNLDPKMWCGGQFWQLVDIKGSRAYYTGEVTDPDTVGVKALDDVTLEVQTENPAGYFIQVCTLPAFMAVPKASIDKALEINGEGRPQDYWKPPIGIYSGPFVPTEWITDLRVKFDANPYYSHGKPKIDQLVINMIQNTATVMAAYEVGELDMVDLPETEYLRVIADPELSADMVTSKELGVQHLVWDMGVPATEDPRVRQAFACAIDRELLMSDILPGVGSPAYQFLAPGLIGYNPEIGQELKYDPDKARKLLSDGGFPNPSDFPEMLINYGAGNTLYQTMFEAIQAMVQDALKIKVTLVPGDQTSLGVKLSDMRYKQPLVWRQFCGADYPDPHNFMVVLYTCPPPQAAVWETPERVLCNEKFDEYVWQAAAETDNAKRADLYRLCEEQLVVENPFVIPLYYPTRHRLIKPYLKNVVIIPQSFVMIREQTTIEK
ncbi:MAG: peptide ABC transporter substrate-binding protein [Chloroflexi bacterium]|nr:peptide ABC transporter substrate-binding protein [Chloroflexota bacterium]